jgi:hypothetical protein
MYDFRVVALIYMAKTSNMGKSNMGQALQKKTEFIFFVYCLFAFCLKNSFG